VTELGFIEQVRITNGGDVEVSFRLPTYWCSANFAYLMASDMHDAIASLPWVKKTNIQLREHFTAKEVSTGASAGRSFHESFAAEADEDLQGIRLLFRRKSFQKRQEILLHHFLSRGEAVSALVTMSLAGLKAFQLNDEGQVLRSRYLQARAWLECEPMRSKCAFHNVDGKALKANEFPDYLRELRRVRLNTEFNSMICRGLLEARYGVRHEDGLVQIEGMAVREVAAIF